jgi:hypothetical protein
VFRTRDWKGAERIAWNERGALFLDHKQKSHGRSFEPLKAISTPHPRTRSFAAYKDT